MGKKYIIELESEPFKQYVGIDEPLYRVKGFNALVFDEVGISKLTPYAEPDLEQVRTEANKIGYEKGYRDGVNRIGDAEDKIRKEAYEQGRKDVETQFCSYDACKNRQEEYQRGLADAWDAARKILFNPDDGGMSAIDVNEVFGENSWTVMKDFSAAEVVAKIKEFEDSKQKIKVWDEICCIANPDIKVCVTNIEDGYFSGFTIKHPDRSNIGEVYAHRDIVGWEKTGDYFPEIAAVLEKMKNEPNAQIDT